MLLAAGAIIRLEMTRHPLLPMHTATRTGLIDTERRLDQMVLRWGRDGTVTVRHLSPTAEAGPIAIGITVQLEKKLLPRPLVATGVIKVRIDFRGSGRLGFPAIESGTAIG